MDNFGIEKSWLMWEIGAGNISAVQKNINGGMDVNFRYNHITPLGEAAARGFDNIVTLLLDAGAKINAKCGDDSTALYRAVAFAPRLDTAELLIRRGARRLTDTEYAEAMAWRDSREKDAAKFNKEVIYE